MNFDDVIESVRKPFASATSLSPEVFTSPKWFDFEKEHILYKHWNFVGLQQNVPGIGDYFVTELYGESIIIIRDHDKRLHAFLNVCRHRCSKVLSDSGSCRVIRCPFHAWTYRLDGSLKRATDFPDMPEHQKKELGLKELRCESWQGLIFVTFSQDTPSIDEMLSDLSEDFHNYPLEEMHCVRERKDEVRVNWKLYNDIDTDPGHGPVHSSTIGAQEYELSSSKRYYRTLFMPSNNSSALLPKDYGNGFDHIPNLPGRAKNGTLYLQFFPALYVILTQDCAWWLNKTPVDHQTTILRVGYMFPKETVQRDDFEEVVKTYFQRWDQVVEEDNWIMEQQQLGMSSAFSSSGPLSEQDRYVWDLHNWYVDRVQEAKEGIICTDRSVTSSINGRIKTVG